MSAKDSQQQSKINEAKVQTRAAKGIANSVGNTNKDEQQLGDNSTVNIIDQLNSIKKSLDAINKALERNTSEAKATNESIKKLQNDFDKINSNLKEMREDIDENSEKLEVMGKNMDCTEKKVENQQKLIEEQCKIIKSQQITINSLQQQNKSTQLSIHNIPNHLNKTQVHESLSSWSSVDISNNTIKQSSLSKKKSSTTATCYIDFYSKATKDQFMSVIKSKQRDVNGKYVPITCEQIFDIPEDDPCRGLEINVRMSLSDYNWKIFKQVRDNRSIFNFVWVDTEGFIAVKEKKDDKPIRITSLEQLDEEIYKKQNKKQDESEK